jgi:hypothetical protein
VACKVLQAAKAVAHQVAHQAAVRPLTVPECQVVMREALADYRRPAELPAVAVLQAAARAVIRLAAVHPRAALAAKGMERLRVLRAAAVVVDR